jgi:hypothetical protein
MRVAIFSFVTTLVFVLTSCGGGGGGGSSANSLQSALMLQKSGFVTGFAPVLMVGE